MLLLEHTGSTSVPGLAAKPIIDMTLAVPDSADEDAYLPELEAAGYVLRIREPDWFEHRVFKGPDTNVNLHVFSDDCPEIDRMLAIPRLAPRQRGGPEAVRGNEARTGVARVDVCPGLRGREDCRCRGDRRALTQRNFLAAPQAPLTLPWSPGEVRISPNERKTMTNRIKNIALISTSITALALGGSAIAGAASGSGSSSSGSSSAIALGRAAPSGLPPQRADETLLTGNALAQVRAAALAKVSGGTIERVETDADGNAKYEAHMTRSDGSRVTVYVNESFNVVGVKAGP